MHWCDDDNCDGDDNGSGGEDDGDDNGGGGKNDGGEDSLQL